MSEGPISQARRGRRGEKVSTPASSSIHAHAEHLDGRVQCGRRVAPAKISRSMREVTCADCLAALRADGLLS